MLKHHHPARHHLCRAGRGYANVLGGGRRWCCCAACCTVSWQAGIDGSAGNVALHDQALSELKGQASARSLGCIYAVPTAKRQEPVGGGALPFELAR